MRANICRKLFPGTCIFRQIKLEFEQTGLRVQRGAEPSAGQKCDGGDKEGGKGGWGFQDGWGQDQEGDGGNI